MVKCLVTKAVLFSFHFAFVFTKKGNCANVSADHLTNGRKYVCTPTKGGRIGEAMPIRINRDLVKNSLKDLRIG